MILTMANIKGGTGKTTTALSLATAFARSGRTVVVVDTDPGTGGTAYTLGETAKSSAAPLPFAVIHKPISPRELDTDADIFFEAVKQTGPYDVTIIDTQSSSTAVVFHATKAADFVVVPCTSSPVDLYPTLTALEYITAPHAVVLTRTGDLPR